MSKAFDSIRHYLIIRKLRKASVSESVCAWFESYLSQSHQVVKFQNTVSDPLPLTPYGTARIHHGPGVIYIVCKRPLSSSKILRTNRHVDDTKLFLGFPASELNDVISAVNENLKKISIWCSRNSLPINPDKTKFLYVGVPQLMRT